MSETLTINPALSPAFDRARKISRVMAAVFAIGFWLTLAGTLVILAVLLIPLIPALPQHDGSIHINTMTVNLGGLSLWQRAWAVLMLEFGTVPILFLMHHARHVFAHFARGEVFAAQPIAHIRAAGVSLIAIFVLQNGAQMALAAAHFGPDQALEFWPLVTGVTTFIAAHVMAEAQAIAADHAEIV